MFGIGGFELFLIILFGFLIFGPDKLPEIAKTVGMAINKFKKAKDEMDGVIREEVFDPSADEPFKDPAKAIDRAHGVVKEKIARGEHEETFAERKARYDRERAEMKNRSQLDQQKQAEIDANRAKMRAEAAQKAEADAQATAETLAQEQTIASDSTQDQPQKLTADELYGNVPLNKEFVRSEKPAPKAAKDSGAPEKPAPKTSVRSDDSAKGLASSKGGEA